MVEGGEEEPVAQVGQGGTARVALPGMPEPACINPYSCRGAEVLAGVVFEAPLVLGPELEHRPLLAEETPSFEAGTLRLNPFTVEYRLREGITFSDGKPLTSADARWTYEEAIRLAREGGASVPYPGFGRVERVETPDERTVRLVFGEPYSSWRELLSAPILPRHAYESKDLARLDLAEGAVGSGPFVLREQTRETFGFEESQSYWVEEPALPNLEGLEVRFGDAAAGALAAGEADFGLVEPGEEALTSGALLSARATPARVEVLLFNARRGVLREREAREAVIQALDRKAIAGLAGAPVAQSFVPPELVPGYVPAWERYDREGISQETRPEGPLVLVYPEATGGPGTNEVVRALASELGAAGIEVEARGVPPAELFDETLPRGDFDLALYAGHWPEALETFPSNVPLGSREALLGSLSAVAGGEQVEALSEAQEVMAREAALVPLFAWPDAYAWTSALFGSRPGTPRDAVLWNVREWGFYK